MIFMAAIAINAEAWVDPRMISVWIGVLLR
jgi:hypothetical protein